MRFRLPIALILLGVLAGCGTTRWSDTQRTATEQLLLSDAMDRAINRLDFRGLAGKTVYLDPTALRASVDALYLASSVRQQMMAHGCIVKDRREDADYVVEIRAGAIGTDHRELLFGVPATNMPQVVPVSTVPAAIPEVPLAKKTEQRAVAKIAVFAYNRETGRPVWQSGTVPVESDVRDVWVLGAGPFQRGGIVDARKKALAKKKKKQPPPLLRPGERSDGKQQFAVTDEAYFVEPVEEVARRMLRSDGSSQTNLAAPSGIRGPEFPSPPVGPGSGAAPGPGQKPPASPSPLDAVVPTANLDPGGFSSQPTSGMAGGSSLLSEPAPAPLPLGMSTPSVSIPITLPSAASAPSTPSTPSTAPQNGAPVPNSSHGAIIRGKG